MKKRVLCLLLAVSLLLCSGCSRQEKKTEAIDEYRFAYSGILYAIDFQTYYNDFQRMDTRILNALDLSSEKDKDITEVEPFPNLKEYLQAMGEDMKTRSQDDYPYYEETFAFLGQEDKLTELVALQDDMALWYSAGMALLQMLQDGTNPAEMVEPRENWRREVDKVFDEYRKFCDELNQLFLEKRAGAASAVQSDVKKVTQMMKYYNELDILCADMNHATTMVTLYACNGRADKMFPYQDTLNALEARAAELEKQTPEIKKLGDELRVAFEEFDVPLKEIKTALKICKSYFQGEKPQDIRTILPNTQAFYSTTTIIWGLRHELHSFTFDSRYEADEPRI